MTASSYYGSARPRIGRGEGPGWAQASAAPGRGCPAADREAVTKIHVGEKPEIGRRLAALIRKAYKADPLLWPYVELLEAASRELEKVMAPRTRGTAESIGATATATELDGVRDDESRALYYVLLAYSLQRHDPDAATAAQMLIDVLLPDHLAVVDLPYARQSTELEKLLDNAAQTEIAAKLASLPAVAATPALRSAILESVETIRDAKDNWNGVLYGYLGALRRKFPGRTRKAQAKRDTLLVPLREAQAQQKGRTTTRRKRGSAAGGATGTGAPQRR
ncbi:MAG: hypothetical protein QME96_15015, partial [Myxococcota bacterium]|nr:hypothetical protein [Myxococcota bacterium]